MFPSFWIGQIHIFTYPLILGLLFGLSFEFGKFLLVKKHQNFEGYRLFFLGCFFFSWVGAKILFLITLDKNILNKAITSQNFWIGGGFVFYGGLIFGLLFTLIYSFRKSLKITNFSFMIPTLVLCHSIGRVACFLAGCCFGTYSDLPWAIEMHGLSRHPVQIYESLILFLLFMYLYKRYINGKTVLYEYLISYAIIRFALEFFRADLIRGVYLFDVSTSQIISFLLLCISFFMLYKNRLRV